jgi:hypothetical protein
MATLRYFNSSGNAEKNKTATGWHPQIPLNQSSSDLLNDWRQRVKTEAE